MSKPFTLGIVAMAAKPPHAGHIKLLELACRECDVAYAFVSTADRARPGELEVTWAQVEPTWTDDIVPSLPENFKFVPTREAPVRKAYELIEQADPKWRIALYGRADGELSQRFRNMPQNVTVRDVTLGSYSGTAVRQAIAAGDYSEFEEMMAPQVNALALWKRLVNSKMTARRSARVATNKSR